MYAQVLNAYTWVSGVGESACTRVLKVHARSRVGVLRVNAIISNSATIGEGRITTYLDYPGVDVGEKLPSDPYLR